MEQSGKGRGKQPYSRADMRRWKTDMLLKAPAERPPVGLVKGVNIVSFRVGPSGNGLWLHITDGTGAHGTILLNPVVAAALRDAISEFGPKAGWLDDKGRPVTPDD